MRNLGIVLLLISGPLLAFGQLPTVIYSTVDSSMTSDVPGIPGAKFTSFTRPYRSANDMYWAIMADTDLDTSEDNVLMTAELGVDAGVVRVQEGQDVPFEGAGVTWGSLTIDYKLGLNDSGHFAFSNNLEGAADSDKDEMIVVWDGSSFSAAYREGSPVPGFPTEFIGNYLNSPSLTNDGRVGARAYSTDGTLPSTEDDFLLFDNTVYVQEGVTVPGGIADPWDTLDSNDFHVSADGNTWFALGDTTASTSADDIVVVNGNAMIVEGATLGSYAEPVDNIVEGILTPEGHWFARGDNDDDQDWVVMDGNVIAQTGDPVPGGFTGESFDDERYGACFFEMTANGVGDYVYAGVTDYADPNYDAVVVLNGAEVVLRQGDAVDLDGNGLLDDGAYIDVFNNDDMFLTDDLWLYFTADLRDDSLADIGQAYLRVLIPEPATFSLLAVGALALLRRR